MHTQDYIVERLKHQQALMETAAYQAATKLNHVFTLLSTWVAWKYNMVEIYRLSEERAPSVVRYYTRLHSVTPESR